MTLKEITMGLLYEGVSNDDINHAIDGHKYVVINYEGTDGTHNGKRMIQPVAFGCTTAGHLSYVHMRTLVILRRQYQDGNSYEWIEYLLGERLTRHLMNLQNYLIPMMTRL